MMGCVKGRKVYITQLGRNKVLHLHNIPYLIYESENGLAVNSLAFKEDDGKVVELALGQGNKGSLWRIESSCHGFDRQYKAQYVRLDMEKLPNEIWNDELFRNLRTLIAYGFLGFFFLILNKFYLVPLGRRWVPRGVGSVRQSSLPRGCYRC